MSWLQCFHWDRNEIPSAPFCTLRYRTCCHITRLITCLPSRITVSNPPCNHAHMRIVYILFTCIESTAKHSGWTPTTFRCPALVSCATVKLNLICRQCKLYLVRQRVLIVLLLLLCNLEPKILIPISGCTALTLNFLLSFLPLSPSSLIPLYLQQDTHGSIWSRPSCSFLGVYRL